MTKKEFMKDFGENLAMMMRNNKMNQKDLSEHTSLSIATINRYLHGQRIPSLIHLINITRALRCCMDDLVDSTEMIK